MKPTRANFTKYFFPINVTRLQLARSGIPSIRAANGTTDTMATLREIESIAYCSSHAIIITPHKKVCTDSTLHDAIFNEVPNLVVDKRRNNRRTKTKTFPETSRDVVFTTTLPSMKLSRGANATLTRVKPKHYLT
jgi:hypothetical protein